MGAPEHRGQRGFSLLEMVVAMAILGLALGALYQASTAATRNVRIDERYAYAVELARSLAADSAIVPAEGVRRQGETGSGFQWEVQAQPLPRPRDSRLAPGMLQDLAVEVSWVDGGKRRRVRLHSVVEGQRLRGSPR
ncbi:MAG: type IV pilus modification PilV family protein [Pseudohaliea sp.]